MTSDENNLRSGGRVPRDEDEPQQVLEDSIQHLELFERRLRGANEAAPLVRQAIDQLRWQRESIVQMPESLKPSISEHAKQEFRTTRDFLKQVVPLVPSVELPPIESGTGLTTTTSSEVFSMVVAAEKVDDQHGRRWAFDRKEAYRNVQRENQPTTRSLLKGLNSPLAAEYAAAISLLDSIHSAASSPEATALAWRTLLDRVRGELLEKARRWPDENMTWSRMAKRLAKGKASGAAAKKLTEQEHILSKIKGQLSTVAKKRSQDPQRELEDAVAQANDFLLATLRLTQL